MTDTKPSHENLREAGRLAEPVNAPPQVSGNVDEKEIINQMAQAIAGVRWDKVEKPAGNTQGREEYSYYLKNRWMDEATAAYNVISTERGHAARTYAELKSAFEDKCRVIKMQLEDKRILQSSAESMREALSNVLREKDEFLAGNNDAGGAISRMELIAQQALAAPTGEKHDKQ